MCPWKDSETAFYSAQTKWRQLKVLSRVRNDVRSKPSALSHFTKSMILSNPSRPYRMSGAFDDVWQSVERIRIVTSLTMMSIRSCAGCTIESQWPWQALFMCTAGGIESSFPEIALMTGVSDLAHVSSVPRLLPSQTWRTPGSVKCTAKKNLSAGVSHGMLVVKKHAR